MIDVARQRVPMRRTAAVLATGALAALLLAGCQNGTASKVTANAAAPTARTLNTPPEAVSPTVPPIPAAQATLRFDQVLGVPTNKADSLATDLGRYARGRNLTLVRRGDPTASYRVLGYLSAVGGDEATNVTYVWDILDASGNRLHRITGIEIAGKADADPWSGVNEAVLNAVAARTVEQIYAWLNQVPAGPGAPPMPAAAAPMPGTAI
ncbi:hypothetical protein [Chthonobacter rhizosphaerae]|uniref:hypothetical protein n=1 Tax=Chthonobacter rhizosphaerae TaxID=2735553 RepID=UPI0015EE732D|nr:hypothetical protein [Chthonobacter rhizosphaerae]